MGTYVYALRSPTTMRKCIVRKIDGELETINIGCFQYVYKPHTSNLTRHYDTPYLALLTKMDNKWKSIPDKIPECFVFTDKDQKRIYTGMQVVHIPNKRLTSFCDMGTIDIRNFGYVVEILED